MKQAIILEHAEVAGTRGYKASGKSIGIVHGKVCAVLSGGKLAEESNGGETHYCSVFLDGGQELFVCGDAERVSQWLGINADI